MGKCLSIIVPSYNMEAYLSKCLGSLLVEDKQLLQKLDVIVVNDGSKDRTSAIAHEFEAKYSGIFRVLDKENGHYGSCINAALPMALGTYVKVLDADDWFDSESFSFYLEVVDNISSRAEIVDLIVNEMDIVDYTGSPKQSWRYSLPTKTVFGMEDIASMPMLLLMHCVAFRTENMLRSHYKQTERCLYTDNEWLFKGMETVKTAFFVKRSMYKYFVGREGQSADLNVVRRLAHQHMEVLDRLLDEYDRCKDVVSPDCQLFLRKYLKRLYSISLYHFVQWPFEKKNRVFYIVDKKFKKYMNEARTELGRKYIVFGNRIKPFHYMTAWQNWPLFRTFPIRFAKCYLAIRVAIRRTLSPTQNGKVMV